MSDVKERITKILVEHLGVEESEVVDTANLEDDLNADSLDKVELVMAFEEEFSIEIQDDDLEAANTVAELTELVEKALAS